MQEFNSKIDTLGQLKLPEFSGTRILMMPFLLEDLGSIPGSLYQWTGFLNSLIGRSPCQKGIAYLTIDECQLRAGEIHRRPGLHVDGWHDDSNSGGWGGGGWGSSVEGEGMLIVASHLGSVGYQQRFLGTPNKFGDCEHLRIQINRPYIFNNGPTQKIDFEPNTIYRLDGMTVHESIPVKEDCDRQFVRLSMPSKANWNSSNTPNPLGILPEGKIVEPRPDEFTAYGAKFV